MIRKFLSGLLPRIPEEVLVAMALIAAAVSFGLEGSGREILGIRLSRLGLATFGVILVSEIRLSQHKMKKSVEELERYSYLHTRGEIWERATELVERARKGGTITGTASNLNDLDFESILLSGVEAGHFSYTRVFCYSDGEGSIASDLECPSPDRVTGTTKRELLSNYLDFYQDLHKFSEHRSGDDGVIVLIMRTWSEGFGKLRGKLGHLEMEHHKSFLPMDFLILHSPDGHCEEAMQAFPKWMHETYESGFWTNNHRLAHDFSQNLGRVRSISSTRDQKG